VFERFVGRYKPECWMCLLAISCQVTARCSLQDEGSLLLAGHLCAPVSCQLSLATWRL
jgi:hypothetical protein